MSQGRQRIIQISDIHLFADPNKELLGVKTQQGLQSVLDILTDESDIAFILLSGDLSQDGSADAYKRLAEMLQPMHVPIYYVPGNHDNVKIMSAVFPHATISNHKHIVLKNWHFILLNSQIPGAVEGHLDKAQLSYLQHCLQTYPEHRAIIAFHHQPVSVGCQWLDNLGLDNADEFWKILSHYPAVHTVLYGHVHQGLDLKVGHIHCLSAPATCFQFKRHQDQFGLEKLPPGYRWIDLFDDGHLESGIKRVAEYVGVFDDGAKGY